ncbi:hypothetical protein B0H66DRAFT_551915, partial [Apodospora peruviana]
IRKKVDGLVSMANPDMKGAARGIGQDLLALVQKTHNASQAQTGNISLANFRKVVAEEVKAAVNGTQEKRSWAAVASQGPTHSQAQPTTATKRLRGKGMPADLAKRTPQEIIQAVNQASTKKELSRRASSQAETPLSSSKG